MTIMLQLIGMIAASFFSALALYGAIRKDLATAVATAANAQDMAVRAHARIDAILERVKT